MKNLNRGIVAIAVSFLGLSAGAVRAQPFNLTTGVGDANVTLGVDGFGAFGSSPGPNTTDPMYDPIGATGPIATVFESGLAFRIGAAGPRVFLASGLVGGSGGLPNPVVTGTATTGTSTFNNSGLSFSLDQTVAPSFNGALRTGAMLTQTYTITNTTAAAITFELVRYVDTQRNVYGGGRFFAAGRQEVLYADETPINPLVFGITGIGGTPLASNRFEIKDRNILPAPGPVLGDILTGAAMNDLIGPGAPYNWSVGLRNVFTVAPGASTTYTTHTVWGSPPAANVIFPTGPGPTPPGPGVLFGCTWTSSELLTINTNPTAGIAAGVLVGPLNAGVVPAGLAYRGNVLYVYDQLADRILEVNPTTAATINTINPNITGVFGEGDIAFRKDGIAFLAPGAPAQLYTSNITVPSSNLITAALSPVIDGMAFDAADVLYGLSEGGGALYTINQTTGATTLVGNTGIAGGFTQGGLAFDSSGNLYAAVGNAAGSFLYQINPTTGVATLLGNIGFNEVSGITLQAGVAGGGGGGGNEGSYAGSSGGGSGSEGTFGSGGRARRSTLAGPFLQGNGHRLVVNIAHRPRAQAVSADDQDLSTWVLALGLAVAAAAVLFLAALRR